MRTNIQKIITILALISIGIFVFFLFKNRTNDTAVFADLQKKTQGYAQSSLSRVENAVITLPDSNTLVGLSGGVGHYTLGVSKGSVKIFANSLTTSFFSGVQGLWPPRLDVLVPIIISEDTFGGSTYVTLFWDRGDATIERSNVRLGGLKTIIESITILPADPSHQSEEYQVLIRYQLTQSAVTKQSIIPVIDGHFDQKNVKNS